jgi:hypothetical protein
MNNPGFADSRYSAQQKCPAIGICGPLAKHETQRLGPHRTSTAACAEGMSHRLRPPIGRNLPFRGVIPVFHF